MSQDTTVLQMNHDEPENNNTSGNSDKKSEKGGVSKAGVAAVAAAGAAVLVGGAAYAMNHNPGTDPAAQGAKPEVQPEAHPGLAHTVTDTMTFSQAFAAARTEMGPQGTFLWHGHLYGTALKSEVAPTEVHVHIDNPTIPEPAVVTPVIYQHPPVATHVNDNMSFVDAMTIARNEVGAGGYFSFHGVNYSTYTQDEMNQFTPEQRLEINHHLGEMAIQFQEPPVAAQHVEIVQVSTPSTDDMHQKSPEDLLREKLETAVKDGDAYVKHGAHRDKYFIDTDHDGKADEKIVIKDDGHVKIKEVADGHHVPGHVESHPDTYAVISTETHTHTGSDMGLDGHGTGLSHDAFSTLNI